MKSRIYLLVNAGLLLAASPLHAVVGYVNVSFNPGYTLFENPLQNTDNHLSAVMPTAPDGTVVSLWNSSAATYGQSLTYDGLGHMWVDSNTLLPSDVLLNPGTGARWYNPGNTLFTGTFTGNVLNHDGTPFDGSNFSNPPPFSGPNGRYLLGDKAPVAATGDDIFLHILGRNPNVGEQYVTLSDTYAYEGSGTWLKDGSSIAAPSYAPGDAAFFDVVVPEPSLSALGLIGLAVLRRHLRCKV